jgi:hypothetical protein
MYVYIIETYQYMHIISALSLRGLFSSPPPWNITSTALWGSLLYDAMQTRR